MLRVYQGTQHAYCACFGQQLPPLRKTEHNDTFKNGAGSLSQMWGTPAPSQHLFCLKLNSVVSLCFVLFCF